MVSAGDAALLLRQESERGHVARPYDREVPLVEGEDLSDPQTLGDGDDGDVNTAEPQAGVGANELRHPTDVAERQGRKRERPVVERVQERSLAARPELPLHQMADLGEDGRGEHDRAWRVLDHLHTALMVLVARVRNGDGGAGVDDDAHRGWAKLS